MSINLNDKRIKMPVKEFMTIRGEAYYSWPKLKVRLDSKIIDTIERSGNRYEISYYLNRWFKWGRTNRCSVNGDTIISVE